MAGFFWKPASNKGALLSMISGTIVWIAMEIIDPEGTIPPQLYGFAVALIGMFVGSLIWKRSDETPPPPPEETPVTES